MAEEQSVLDRWFLKQEIIDQLLAHGEEEEDAERFGQRIAAIAVTEEAEHQSLHDPSTVQWLWSCPWSVRSRSIPGMSTCLLF